MELWLIRHGETEWSRSGAHTGTTDIPLTDAGVRAAEALRERLASEHFSAVLTSPLKRARDTCSIAGFAERAAVDAALVEWNYGDYEGRTTPEIRQSRPDWSLWRDGAPNGETLEEVASRAQALIARVAAGPGRTLLFAHGHILRVLGACWAGLPPVSAQALVLGTASVSVLGFERETRAIVRWNS